ncbi:MAG: hypothetical protein PHW43_00765 [Syntrophales bacterium]|jgi:hypothetical protein|nr:hypothetical protein [Syntrophales bacterium]
MAMSDKVRFKDLVDVQDPVRNARNGNLPAREAAAEADADGEQAASPAAGEKIFELTEILEECSPPLRAAELNDVIQKVVAEIAERVAREMVPGIAERIIREEIEKLKSEDEDKTEQS